jgi:hypothetical protein
LSTSRPASAPDPLGREFISSTIATMMQSCASRRSSGAAGPFFRTVWEPWVYGRVTATSDRHRQSLAQGCQSGCPVVLLIACFAHDAGRKTTPRGSSPVVTRCQRAMSSLRASATIMVLRVLPRPSAVRSLNHWARALSFWNLRKRQANWIMPHRTRALPARARPRSRRRLPLSSGEPVRPAYRATALRSRSGQGRQNGIAILAPNERSTDEGAYSPS